MENFIFHVPTKVFFGKDQEKNVGNIIKEYGFKNILVHYGKNSVIKSGLLDKVKSYLEEANIKYTLFGGVEPNPKLSLVHEGIEIVKKNNIDFILAIGGGSVIDSAKLISTGALVDFDPWLFSIKEKSPEKHIPVGSILTIAASGSEMSQSCVITNENGNLKRGFNSPHNRCLFSILNPELTYTVDRFQTACGIVDILMHTMERYFTYEKNVELTDFLSEGLINAVLNAGLEVLSDLHNYEARATLMFASSLSHNDLFGVGRDVYMSVHQLEHELSGMYDYIAHGAGLSALYCSWARYVYRADKYKFSRFAYAVLNVPLNVNRENASLEGIARLEQYFRRLDMPTNLRELNVNKEDLPLLAKMFTFDGKRETFNDIVKLGYEEALEIYTAAYDA